MVKKSVLVLATTFPRWENDSTPRFVYNLSKELVSRYKIIVLAPHHKGAAKMGDMAGMDIRRFAYFKPESLQKLCYGGGIIPNMKSSFLAKIQMPFLIMSEFTAAHHLINKEKIEMMHAHWILPQGLIGVFLKKIRKIPLLVSVHGSDLFPLKSAFFKNMQHFVIKNADFITVNSEATKKELLQRFPQYSSKVKMIPMGVDMNLFKPRNIRKPKKYGKTTVMLFVGRLSDQKGLQYLIESMPDVIEYSHSIKLLVIGEGPYGKILKDIVIDNHLEKHVEFLGSMKSAEITKYYNFADIFILPSLSNKTGTEALGLSLLEAMASGCAVIGTRVGGIPFIIKDNYNGLLVEQRNSAELAKAILTLLKDKSKARKLGRNAAQLVRKSYSWDKISNQFMEIYGDLLK